MGESSASILPYILPVLTDRLAQQEILEPAEEIRLVLVQILVTLVTQCQVPRSAKDVVSNGYSVSNIKFEASCFPRSCCTEIHSSLFSTSTLERSHCWNSCTDLTGLLSSILLTPVKIIGHERSTDC
jgi:hypothetical protein